MQSCQVIESLHQDHSLYLHEAAGRQLVDVHSACHTVRAPRNTMVTSGHLFICEPRYFSAEHVVDKEFNISWPEEFEADLGCWVEWVGIILFNCDAVM